MGQIPLPNTCPNGPFGLAFDGLTLYYTLSGEPAPGTVYMVDAKTGADRGNFVANRSAVPIGEGMYGLAFDPNRGWLWAGSIDLYALAVPSGEAKRQFALTDWRGVSALAYDPVLDKLWEGDDDPNSVICWRPDGWPCGAMNSSSSDRGLAHDGVDLWRYTAGPLPFPAPASPGVIVPSLAEQQTDDLLRTFDIPGVNYRDIAYDCSTFTVPVVWVTDWWNCRLNAYEVESHAPFCVTTPGPRILRGHVDAVDPAKVASKLPLVTANADWIWRAPSPLDFVDDRDRVLTNDNRPFVVYRMLGPGDAPVATPLKLVKEKLRGAIRIVP